MTAVCMNRAGTKRHYALVIINSNYYIQVNKRMTFRFDNFGLPEGLKGLLLWTPDCPQNRYITDGQEVSGHHCEDEKVYGLLIYFHLLKKHYLLANHDVQTC